MIEKGRLVVTQRAQSPRMMKSRDDEDVAKSVLIVHGQYKSIGLDQQSVDATKTYCRQYSLTCGREKEWKICLLELGQL